VRGASNLRIRCPQGRGGSTPPSRTFRSASGTVNDDHDSSDAISTRRPSATAPRSGRRSCTAARRGHR
jgi:hypothetical protein